MPSSMKVLLPDDSELELAAGATGLDAARAIGPKLAEQAVLAKARDWPEVTVDPSAWNDRAIRAWEKAGFVEVSRRPPDDEHSADWILMRFAATLTA